MTGGGRTSGRAARRRGRRRSHSCGGQPCPRQCCHARLIVRIMARARLLRTPPGYVLEAALILCCVCSSLGQYPHFPFLEGQQGRLDVIEEPLVQPIDPQTGRTSRCYDETGKAQVGGGSGTCSEGSLRSAKDGHWVVRDRTRWGRRG